MNASAQAWRAPGKVILLGEYAVLHGHAALVAAVDRFATCRVAPSPVVEVVAPGHGHLVQRAGAFEGEGDLRFVRAWLDAHGAPAGRYTLDTRDLGFAPEGGAWTKLGLGSSAASTVAFLAAVRDAAGLPTDAATLYCAAQRLHRAVQGTGSGADVAASAFGGVGRYRWREAAAGPLPAGDGAGDFMPVPGPARLLLAWAGRPASTVSLVGRVRAWAAGAPDAHRRLIERIAAVAQVDLADPVAIVQAVRAGADALEALGAASGAPIVTETHRALDALARGVGGAAKPTGAGGGDLAWLVAPDAQAEAALAHRVDAAGFPVWSMTVAAAGATAAP
ncbi:MAG: hypothetical protein H6704_12265 [Myxococcales bacterium]|nr:hypothetical protein [Myxococcales bacterium]